MTLQTKINGLKEVWQFDNRIWLTLTKTFFAKEKLHIYRYKGLEILVDHAAGDANGAREVLTSAMYRRFLPLMKLQGAINVLDLGGNNGGFPLLLKAEGIEIKKVVSVELNPKTFSRLRFNLERNLDCEIVAINAALCGEERELNIPLGVGSVSDSIYENNINNGKGKIYHLRGLTLDGICVTYFGDETIDICKMDVEGAEFEVFLLPQHQCLKNCRYLIMEIHERDGRTKEEILPAIEKLGFIRQPNAADADPTVHLFVNSNFN
ncbi:MAG: FkbM family methyltransferase [Pyrinomonadaceae bacterium]